jgi:hypothetical protein
MTPKKQRIVTRKNTKLHGIVGSHGKRTLTHAIKVLGRMVAVILVIAAIASTDMITDINRSIMNSVFVAGMILLFLGSAILCWRASAT